MNNPTSDDRLRFQQKCHKSMLNTGAIFKNCKLRNGDVLQEVTESLTEDSEFNYIVNESQNVSTRLIFWNKWIYILCANTSSNITATRIFRLDDDQPWNLESLVAEVCPVDTDNRLAEHAARTAKDTSANELNYESYQEKSRAPFGFAGPFGAMPGSQPMFPSIGASDLYPAGIGGSDMGNDGGMIPTFNHPIFHPENRSRNEQASANRTNIPPGARYDPTGPGDFRGFGRDERKPQFPFKGPRSQFPGEPDNDDFMPPGSSDMFM
ncbi:Silencing boundary-establishment protein FUB1-like protein [Schizosaccharomyces pombe]|uniref:Silencing boundary-establishment protein FUB1-like protein n=1 Tax=Schizosaccharomyces pombe (strain 972 / ATCC 24843) TaxID=284812 RepID=FUB1_SCHPO|nr:putative PI31 proteasome inhibitor domain-containing protein [Schizosaccharomyces pombe]Q9UTI1.2 RecName: Full=Silencing boundary-establishment protein FUB1-like protein; AltName: Full=Proteasome inhibitor PI31-like protein SPAC15E1.10 [Schizosaccharomyces pombe 972h-]CAB52429.2 PI31 proteasome inhibitor (predicted) [Schizosaccharomyces pombe]|eukprot:NP_594311.2 putative PI31 proteasome inhibitor domain-containing protein [Schizosaccharomyces pombe]